nr:hypothetical protein [uncultured Cohaesibacter sp.]
MIDFKTASLPALFLLTALAGCRSVTMGMDDISEMLPSSEGVSGEVQWDFAATNGDVILVGLQDGAGVLEETKVIPTPGVKHVDFDLSVTKNDRTKCASRGSCRYSAQLVSGENVKASGFAYYTPTLHPTILLNSAGSAAHGAMTASGQAMEAQQPQATQGGQAVTRQTLPKPVYR